ncbi:MAG: CoA transferase [Pseudomonadota bacterium]
MQDSILAGIKVVELATYIAGPAAGVVLADFGAEVVKIEAPARPDPFRGVHLRGTDAPLSEHPYAYLVDNRSKRAIALDIKAAEGREIFVQLVASADIFLTNMPVPTRERLAITYDEIRAIKADIVYASVSAYGEKGPEAGRPGFDSTALWARTGMMDLVKPSPESPPARSLPGMGDHPTAMSLYGAIMTGLFHRERTGEGSHVSTSLMANGVWMNGMLAQAALCGATVRGRPGRETAANPIHNLYATRDGRWIHIVFNTNLHRWPEFATTIGRPEIGSDPRFESPEARAHHNVALIQILEEAFATRDFDDWVALLDAERFTFGEVRTVDDMLTDTQMVEGRVLRQMAEPLAGANYIVDSPIWIEDTTKRAPGAPPEVGQHTDEVLSELGYDAAAVARLRAAGITR